jgi:hypothetical protein
MPCSLQAQGVCVPGSVAKQDGGAYLDRACEQPAFYLPAAMACARPPLGVSTIDGAVHVFELTEMPAYYRSDSTMGTDPSCVPSGDDAHQIFAAADDITMMFPRAATLDSGDGPLHQTRFVAPGTTSDAERFIALDSGGPLLDARGRACRIQSAVDGSLRCLPDELRVWEADYFLDAGCGQRLFTADPAAELSDLRVVGWDGSAAPKIATLYSVSVYDGQTYQVVQTRCMPSGLAAMRLLARDQEVSLTTLPSVEPAEL